MDTALSVQRATAERGVLFAVLVLAMLSSPCARETAPYAFTQEGPRYTFVSSFTVVAEPDEVLDLLFEFRHLRQFARRATAVELLAEGPGWQEVRYTYATWVWRIHTTFRRELDRTHRRVRFHMTGASRSGVPVPLPTASTGDYRLEPVAGGLRVIYRQTAETRDTLLLGVWMSRARSEAIGFSQDLEAYVRSQVD